MPELDVSYHDDRLSMLYWWPRLKDLDIPTPDTALFPIERTEGEGFPITWDTERISETISQFDSENAFIRSDRKSAMFIEEGSTIRRNNPEAIDEVIMVLLDSIIMSDQPLTALAVREWLDLDTYAEGRGAPITPEIRAFIDDGDVLCYHLRVGDDDIPNTLDADALKATMQEVADDAWEDCVHEYAQTVANEFSGGWSVDFVPTTNEEWYCTDMALYGLYYFDMKDDEDGFWKGVSYHPSDCPHNLEENHPDELPDTPTNTRTKRYAK